jgi:type I restriction enzyme, S subunit
MSNKVEKRALVPKLRFPEFREAGEWQEKPLGTLGQTISGLSGKSGDDFGAGQPFVTYKQVFDCAWIDFSKCGRVRIADDERQNTLQRGDVLFTTSSETPDEVGYASVLLNSPPGPIYLNSFCFSFRPDRFHTLMPEFSRYLFHSPIYRKSITVLAQGSTRFNISKSAFLKLSVPIPQEPEQKKSPTASFPSTNCSPWKRKSSTRSRPINKG